MCVLVVDSEPQELKHARRVTQSLSIVNLRPGALKLIGITRLGAQLESTQIILRAAFEHNIDAIIEPASEALLEALDRGQPIVLNGPNHPVAVQMRCLAQTLFRACPYMAELT